MGYAAIPVCAILIQFLLCMPDVIGQILGIHFFLSFFFLPTFYFLFLFTGTISLKRPFQLFFFYMFVDISLTAVSMDSFNYTAYTELDLK